MLLEDNVEIVNEEYTKETELIPSPNFPKEVKNVSEMKMYGKNLFNKNASVEYCFTGGGSVGATGVEYYGIKIGKGLGQVYASAINPNKRTKFYYLVAINDNGEKRIPFEINADQLVMKKENMKNKEEFILAMAQLYNEISFRDKYLI